MFLLGHVLRHVNRLGTALTTQDTVWIAVTFGTCKRAPARRNFLEVRVPKVVDRSVIDICRSLTTLDIVTGGRHQAFQPVPDFGEKSLSLGARLAQFVHVFLERLVTVRSGPSMQLTL